MHILEILLGLSLLYVCVKASYTDIKNEVIYNRDLKASFLIGVVLNACYYLFFARDILSEYIINLLIIILLQLILYKTGSFAGGDFKLGMIIAFLYPARMYFVYRGINITLFFYMGFAIFYGYLYLFADSIMRVIKHRSMLDHNYIFMYIKNFLISYIRASIYIMVITLIASKLGEYIYIPSWILWIICMVVSWESRKNSFLKNKITLTIFITFDIVFAVVIKTIPFSIYPETYLFSGTLLVCQMVISSALYETIDTNNVRPGMILSTSTSLLMQESRVKGLPGISSENLSDRLTDEQASSIKRWGNTKNGMNQVVIMRKIPFAVFLFMGIANYFIIWITQYEI